MVILRRPAWHLPEREATPQPLAAVGRRAALAGAAAGLVLARAARAGAAEVNPAFKVDRPLTPEKDVETYNNYYEFGTSKNIWRAAQKLPVKPWSIKLDGMVEKERTLGFDDLLKQVQLEDRTYRHRCVEGWSLTVPWTGFPLAKLVAIAKPLGGAKYVRFETLTDPEVMPGLDLSYFPWPYVEGLTMAEANNELAFVGTGLYGQPLKPQNGAPIRLVVPWKYGFKSIKSIIKVTFTDKRPQTFWEQIQPEEYGFWANVNPAVPHPRWSQATEELIGFGKRVPTLIYNGYGEQVASLYAGLQGGPLQMTLASRVFAVLAAVLLVAAFALAALAPEDLNLAQALALLDHDWLVWLPQHAVGWLWDWVEKPLLVRPVWLLPAAFGIICGGAALTFSSRPPSRSHRRRS